MILRRSLPLLVLALIAAACSGSSNSTPTTPTLTTTTCAGTTAKGTMTATIDGVAWSATCITSASWPNNILTLGASDGKQSVGVGASATGPGTYSMTTGAANGVVNMLPTSAASWDANFTGGTGTLTITQLSTTGASGTFSFTGVPVAGTGATGNKVVTAGAFSITF